MGHFARYEDTHGDGTTPCILPGAERPGVAYFTWESRQGTQPRVSERAEAGHNAGRVGLVGLDSTDLAIMEAVDCLAGSNVRISYLSLPALSFVEIAQEFIEAHERIYVVELNSCSQLYQILHRDYPDLANKLISLCQNSALPLTASWIAENIIACEGEYL